MILELGIGAALGYALRKYGLIAGDYIYEKLGWRAYLRHMENAHEIEDDGRPQYAVAFEMRGSDPALAERFQGMIEAHFGGEDDATLMVHLHHACEHNPWSSIETRSETKDLEEAKDTYARLVNCAKQETGHWAIFLEVHRPETDKEPVMNAIMQSDIGGFSIE